ncbi:semialdehyde dehydrogenase [bacterium]|nr:semialdehyde dehydrogenase [bacterium]
MTTSIALMGAGGKMGCRITDNIKEMTEYDVRYVEVSERGQARLAERGISVTAEDAALADADVVVLAVPDALIGTICKTLIPEVKAGAMVMALDPAAAYAGELPDRADISYFLAHPCHPPLFNDEVTEEGRTDWFGGIHAKQHIVCALHSGPEENYARGEAIARAMYAPVMNSHRVTTEQMALLEPALVETLSATCISIIKEGMDEIVRMGVPEAAAWDFLSGHMRIEMAIIFGMAGFPFSDGAKLAIANAKSRIFRDDWKENVFDMANVKKSVLEITKG